MKKDISILAYTAGIVDGEGCIAIRHQRKQTKSGHTMTYAILVHVDNTNEWLMRWLQFNFGGQITLNKGTGNRRDWFTWRIYTRQAAIFLKLILPYLKIKRPQAELALQYQGHQRFLSGKGNARGTSRLTDGEKAIQEVEYLLMHQLNKRGRQS